MKYAFIRPALTTGATAALLVLAACSSSSPPGPTAAAAVQPDRPYLNQFHVVSQIASTVPRNGDVNPYGIAVVPQSAGRLVRGHVLVSNFNAKSNIQGTGTTVMQIAPDGAASQFARIGPLPASMSCPGGVGLTTALAVLPGGWVVVGSLPTHHGGKLPPADPLGCLIVLDSHGKPVQTWVSPKINGPWDMAVQSGSGHADLYVSNVLSRSGGGSPPSAGLCTVVRVAVRLPAGQRPRMTGVTVVGSGFLWRLSQAALVQGPTGLALGPNGTLYVASTLGNSISVIPHAATRTTAESGTAAVLTRGGGLNGPLGLTRAPDGDLIAVNGNDGNAVEVTPDGRQVARVTLVPGGAGDLFGVTPAADGAGLLFVNDGTNALDFFSG
jgi:DNA-binding beta-propeller fold protein YncE